MKTSAETVFVGLSGGVDSSVAAKRLLDAGKKVVGVFIKTWQPEFLKCDWEKERLDAMRVAAHLGIPFYTCDGEEAYKTKVAEYMIEEYRQGRTPNPDVMCNKHVKFGVFLEWALQNGADKVATGHYAQVEEKDGVYILKRGIDRSKDQSYFLWTLTQEQLSKTYFPIGDTAKEIIRKEAERAGLLTFEKKDSQGICFLGDVDIPEFLSHYVQNETGHVLDEDGNSIGTHSGALMYTLGQRHGFEIINHNVASAPHYIVSKDIEKNTITVSSKPQTLKHSLELTQVETTITNFPCTCEAQFRYRQQPFPVRIYSNGEKYTLEVLDTAVQKPSDGQSCVLYSDHDCLGGGIIDAVQ